MSKTVEWIFKNADHSGAECLQWPFGRDGGGYGRAYSREFKTRLAHRIMCEVAHGKPPFESAVARHICGNGHLGCVNPNHVSWATQAENVADRAAHGTEAVGQKTGVAVMTEATVKHARALSSSGWSIRKIAKQLCVSHGTIQAVVSRRTWRHVE